ncbi:hypothetical protein [Gordonia sp. (in: high G+C Gram-positive bacteria)]|uniref:hypothetical protein n=1 Tax=Gordonia sp. (in: high G+C Gram-positive bacteria) TaxID=84139 RepID=UPI001DEE550A|nr:hypothetical protein [Gordonia sp. (in: high G+C Gram-positive bacteria)]MCB1295843.1 hypothetical protein [Gordonia sp. (in: high G+C Gram-positive bacteria)]HMS75641.1 hypothetical protein [Gordonia sp. (in: high G+C Gram-positive bacteria)]
MEWGSLAAWVAAALSTGFAAFSWWEANKSKSSRERAETAQIRAESQVGALRTLAQLEQVQVDRLPEWEIRTHSHPAHTYVLRNVTGDAALNVRVPETDSRGEPSMQYVAEFERIEHRDEVVVRFARTFGGGADFWITWDHPNHGPRRVVLVPPPAIRADPRRT